MKEKGCIYANGKMVTERGIPFFTGKTESELLTP